MIDIYKKRREKLINEIKDHSMVLLFSGEHLIATSDQNYPFIINKNFFYLTGLDVSEATLLLVKIDQEIYEYLFIEEFNELREKWTGKMLRPNEATEISGIRNILYSSQIDSKIDELIATKSSYGEVNHVYIDHKHKFLCASQTHEELVTYLKRKGKKGLEIIDVYPLLIRQRMVKDDHELELIKKSIKLTNNALKMVLDNLRPGLHEYQIRAMFEYVIRGKNAEIAFDTIVASGPNATILHHVDLSNRLRDGQLVLLDCGASIDKYKADISRTYPVNACLIHSKSKFMKSF
jgi:Xaa-Pro aminopeptidase